MAESGPLKPTTYLCTLDIRDLYTMLPQEESLDILGKLRFVPPRDSELPEQMSVTNFRQKNYSKFSSRKSEWQN
jgi:hypothetical protein